MPICPGNLLGLRFLRRLRLARTVEGDRLAHEGLEGGLVNFLAFVDVDRAPHISLETRVEETGGILQGRALGEGKLHDTLVGFAGADDAVVRPNRGAGFGWFDPLPLLDYVRVCLLDEFAHSVEGFPAPVAEFGDSIRDELRCRLALARVRFFHVLILGVPEMFHMRRCMTSLGAAPTSNSIPLRLHGVYRLPNSNKQFAARSDQLQRHATQDIPLPGIIARRQK